MMCGLTNNSEKSTWTLKCVMQTQICGSVKTCLGIYVMMLMQTYRLSESFKNGMFGAFSWQSICVIYMWVTDRGWLCYWSLFVHLSPWKAERPRGPLLCSTAPYFCFPFMVMKSESLSVCLQYVHIWGNSPQRLISVLCVLIVFGINTFHIDNTLIPFSTVCECACVCVLVHYVVDLRPTPCPSD